MIQTLPPPPGLTELAPPPATEPWQIPGRPSVPSNPEGFPLAVVVDVTRFGQGQATEQRIQSLLQQIAQLFREVEGQIIRLPGSRESRVTPQTNLPPMGHDATQSVNARTRLGRALASLARLAPARLAQLLTRQLAEVRAFPQASRPLAAALQQSAVTPAVVSSPQLALHGAAIRQIAADLPSPLSLSAPGSVVTTPTAGSTLISGALPGISVDPVLISSAARGLANTAQSSGLVWVNEILSERLGVVDALQLAVESDSRRPAPARDPAVALATRLADPLGALRLAHEPGFERALTLLRVITRLSPAQATTHFAEVESQLRAHRADGFLGRAIHVRVDVDTNQRTDMLIADLRSAGLTPTADPRAAGVRIDIEAPLHEAIATSRPLVIDLLHEDVALPLDAA
jgi:hypothetical protein